MSGLKSPIVRACISCGENFSTVWMRQERCVPCGLESRNRHRKATNASRAAVRNDVLETIANTMGKQKTSVLDICGRPDFQWTLTFSVPFMAEASKNRRWSNNGKGAVFLSKGVRQYQDAVIALAQRSLSGIEIKQNKLWIGLLVEKPNHRFDAINVVDTICDAIKIAAGLDDRWFCLSKVDWVIKKKDPSIIISLAQESKEDAIVCSHCGEMKGEDHFTRNRSRHLGRSIVCRKCKNLIDKATREARDAVPISRGVA